MASLLAQQPSTNGVSEMDGMSKEELYAVLQQTLEMTAQLLLRMAVAVRKLEEMGEDLSCLKNSLIPYLRLIACRQMLPEVLLRCKGRVLEDVASLPLPDQQMILEKDFFFKVLRLDAEGKRVMRAIPIHEIGEAERKQIFARDHHIRSEVEQHHFLDSVLVRRHAKTPDRIGDLRIDKDKGGAWVGKKFIPKADLVAAVKAL